MKRPLILCWCCGLAIALIMLLGFNSTAAPPQQEPDSVVLLTQEDTGSFLLQLRYGAQAAADETGDTLSVTRLEASAPEQQLATLKAGNAKAVLLYGTDTQTAARISSACKALALPLVLLDQEGEGVMSVSTNETKAGAEAIKGALALHPHHLLLLADDSLPAQARLKSALRELRGNPVGVTVLPSDNGVWAWPPEAAALLQEGACLVALSKEATQAAIKKKEGDALSNPLIGVDPGNDRVEVLESETVQALVLPTPYTMGYLGFLSAKALLSGEEVQGAYAAPALITLENLYQPENVKIAFPLLQ